MKEIWISNDPNHPNIPSGATVFKSHWDMMNSFERNPSEALKVNLTSPMSKTVLREFWMLCGYEQSEQNDVLTSKLEFSTYG